MPWRVIKQDEGWCVLKEEDNSVIACHPSQAKAKKHIAALYASENKEASEDTENKEETQEKGYTYVPGGIFTFKDLDAYRQSMEKVEEVHSLTNSLRQIIDNIMYFPDIKDKSRALRTLVDEFANRVDSVDTKELDEGLTKEKLDLAAEGELDSKDKRDLRQGYEALGVSDEEIPEVVKEVNDVLVWKEENGSCKVAFIYSNNYRDDDGFPEIIEEKAHKAYTELVNDGVLPKPEMWHWHVPGTRWGEIDYLLYHDGFSVAFGTVDKGKEAEAEAVKAKSDVGVSHGMIKRYMLRSEENPSHIEFYVSKEISDLPIASAANKLTGLTVFGENEMEVKELDAKKKEYLKGLGYSDTKIGAVESMLTAKKEQAEAEDRESKEGGTQEQDDTPTENREVEVVKTISQASGEEGLSVKSLTESILKEVASGLGEVMKPIIDRNIALEGKVGDLVTKLDALEKGIVVEKAKKVMEESPSLSVKELFASAIFGESAQIHGNSALAKDKPVETKEKETTATGPTPSATINAALQAMIDYHANQVQ